MTTKQKLQTLKTPKIGQYWQGQGGVYAGMMRDGNHQWHLILAVAPESKIKAPWGEYGQLIEGEFSRVDGRHNMQLIFTAEPENKIVDCFAKLKIEDHNDFYFPAEYENNLICMNLPEHVEKTWHWSSTQGSANDAWRQVFEDGDQYVTSKYGTLAARAVRRLAIQ